MIDWPDQLGERTPPGERRRGSKFRAGWNQTRRELRRAFDRMGVEEWWLDTSSGSQDEPAVVVHWRDADGEYVIGCDAYTTKRDNLRSCYLWIEETRKRSDRPVRTSQGDFAAAALPPPGDESQAIATRPPAHEVLSVTPDADPDVVEAAAKRLIKKHHPDRGEVPDEEALKTVLWARDQMVGE